MPQGASYCKVDPTYNHMTPYEQVFWRQWEGRNLQKEKWEKIV